MNVELSLAALWADLRLGRFPFPLEVRSHGDTIDVRARIKAAVYADLGRRRLPDDDLVDDLRLLADPAVCLDLVALLDMTDPDPVRAVAVARGRRGLLVVQGKLAVSFSRMRATMIAGALVALLPDTRAALGNSITQPAAALRADQPKHRRVQPGGVLRTAARATRRTASCARSPRSWTSRCGGRASSA